MKASHSFNLLDARRAISVTERQRTILRVRKLSQAVAESYLAQREKLGFPGLKQAAKAACIHYLPFTGRAGERMGFRNSAATFKHTHPHLKIGSTPFRARTQPDV